MLDAVLSSNPYTDNTAISVGYMLLSTSNIYNNNSSSWINDNKVYKWENSLWQSLDSSIHSQISISYLPIYNPSLFGGELFDNVIYGPIFDTSLYYINGSTIDNIDNLGYKKYCKITELSAHTGFKKLEYIFDFGGGGQYYNAGCYYEGVVTEEFYNGFFSSTQKWVLPGNDYVGKINFTSQKNIYDGYCSLLGTVYSSFDSIFYNVSCEEYGNNVWYK